MPGSRDAPEFRKGDNVSAGKLNALGDVARRNFASPGTFSGGGYTAQRRAGVGASDLDVAGNLAIVTTAAAANGGVGSCVMLDIDLEPVVVIDSGDIDYDSDAFDRAQMEFRCAHQYSSCPEGERIQIFSKTGTISTMFGDREVSVLFGLLTDCVVELSTRVGFGAEKGLVGGAGPNDIKWDAGACPPPP